MSELRRCTPPTSRATARRLVRGHGLGRRGGAAEGQPVGRRGHPGRDHPGRAARLGRTPPSPETASRATVTSLTPNVIPGACGPNGQVQLDPEGLSLTHTDSDNPSQPTARSLGITGAGVKVAWIADGVDPNNVNFIRPNGTSVFDRLDYQDFTGDGPGQPTGGDEAFLDANTIAGQGIHVYNVNNFSAQPDPTPATSGSRAWPRARAWSDWTCSAPFEDTTESNFLQAINYAVETDHVNVINESFGSNPFPDVTALDATKQFNDAAVAAGVRRQRLHRRRGLHQHDRLAGDRPERHLGRRLDRLPVLRADQLRRRALLRHHRLAERQHQLAQLGRLRRDRRHGRPGRARRPELRLLRRQPDLLRLHQLPGPALRRRGERRHQRVLAVRGRRGGAGHPGLPKTHGGATPTPALVKQILVSTATDLGAPADRAGRRPAEQLQGRRAGRVDPHQRRLADAGRRHPADRPTSQLNAVGNPGTQAELAGDDHQHRGQHADRAAEHGRTFGPDENVQTGSVTLNDATSPQFVNYQGLANNYDVFHFKVRAGPGPPGRLDRLAGQPGLRLQQRAIGNNARVRLILIDPRGRFAAHSLPQGVGNYGNVDVTVPGRRHLDGRHLRRRGRRRRDQRHRPVAGRDPAVHPVRLGLAVPPACSGPGRAGRSRSRRDHAVRRPVTPPARSWSARPRARQTTSIPVTLRSLVDVAHGRHVQRRADRRQRPGAGRGPGGLLRVQRRARGEEHHRQRVAHQRRRRPGRRAT